MPRERDSDDAVLGRAPERGRIEALVAGARGGRGGVLVLRGEAGAGKSALLAWARGRAAGEMGLLLAQGTESEAELGFSGLFDLLRPALGRLAALPDPQAAALRGAFALGPPGGDRLAVHLAALGLLAAHAERHGPQLGLVDDAHWLDVPSQDALAFCARRLRDDPVALLVAMREEEPGGGALRALPALAIGPLDGDAAAALLRRSAPEPLAPAVEARLLEACAGHPLALVEVQALLTPAQRRGAEPLPDPLPAGAWLRQAWIRRLDALSPEARGAVELLAASDTGAFTVLDGALRAMGAGFAALEEAEAALLVEIGEDRVAFRHPLVRSVIQEATAPRGRRAAHRALAAASRGERRAWHLAGAALGPDAEAATALAEVGGRLRDRADPVGASRALERAADLTADPRLRVDRLLAAAGQAHLAFRPEAALALLDRAAEAGADALQRADAERLRARILIWQGELAAAHRGLIDAADSVLRRDPGRATGALADAALVLLMAGRTREGMAAARRAWEVSDAAGPEARMAARASLGWALILRGFWRAGYPLVAAAAGAPADLTGARDPVNLARECAIWVEDWETAEAVLPRLVAETRAAGAVGALAYPLGCLADLEFRTGRWAAALAHAAEAVQVAEVTGQRPGFALAKLARIEAARGDEAACRAHAAALAETARTRGFESLEAYGCSAVGALELAAGRPAEAAAALRRAARLAAWGGMEEPAVDLFGPDLVEALARAGDARGAAAALRAFAEQAERVGRSWPRAALARCRGLIAAEGGFDGHFAEAERRLAGAPMPFERARTALAHGERLRRARRRREARLRLGAALEAFDELGAAAWAERARAELRVSGARARGRREPAGDELTAQELTVAQAVVEGATNREVAARLFVSPKTVEGHLGHIYRKLGVRSRTQLAARMRAAGTGGFPRSGAGSGPYPGAG
jgi:DNA-binding CsgD family transcriptional regulator